MSEKCEVHLVGYIGRLAIRQTQREMSDLCGVTRWPWIDQKILKEFQFRSIGCIGEVLGSLSGKHWRAVRFTQKGALDRCGSHSCSA